MFLTFIFLYYLALFYGALIFLYAFSFRIAPCGFHRELTIIRLNNIYLNLEFRKMQKQTRVSNLVLSPSFLL